MLKMARLVMVVVGWGRIAPSYITRQILEPACVRVDLQLLPIMNMGYGLYQDVLGRS